MRKMFTVLGAALLLSACTSPLPAVISTASNPDDPANVPQFIPYTSPVIGFYHRAVTDPKNWRDQNKAQAPSGAAQ